MTRPPLAYLSPCLNTTRLASALFILLCYASAHAQEVGQKVTARSPIEVGVGKATTIATEGDLQVVQVDIADGSIAGAYQYTDSSVVVTGKKLGSTAIILWYRSGTTVYPDTLEVHVDTTPTLTRLADDLTTFIRNSFGKKAKDVTVTPTPGMDKVVVSGKVKDKKIAAAIISAVESFQLPSSSIVNNLR